MAEELITECTQLSQLKLVTQEAFRLGDFQKESCRSTGDCLSFCNSSF